MTTGGCNAFEYRGSVHHFFRAMFEKTERAQKSLRGKRVARLSITHMFGAQQVPDLDVCKAGDAAPDDGIAGRWIARTSKIAAEPRQLRQAGAQRRRLCLRSA